MKRRSFLKTTLVSPLVTMLPIELLAKEKTKINYSNIKINGSFLEWTNNIAEKINNELFNKKLNIRATIEQTTWMKNEPLSISALRIKFLAEDCSYLWKMIGCFSIAEYEFNKLKNNPKHLQHLIRIRFRDCLHYMAQYKTINSKHLNELYKIVDMFL